MGSIFILILAQGSTAQQGSGDSIGYLEPVEALVPQVLSS